MQIIAHDNFEGSCQMWSFELVQLDQPDVTQEPEDFVTLLYKTLKDIPPRMSLADDKFLPTAPISLNSNQILGITPKQPLVLFSEAMPEEGMKPWTEYLHIPPDSQSPPLPQFCRYSGNFEFFKLLTFAFSVP